jgi:hypothetical protein
MKLKSKKITGDLKIDSKNLNPPRKVQKLKNDLANICPKSLIRSFGCRPGEFVQPTKGISVSEKLKINGTM